MDTDVLSSVQTSQSMSRSQSNSIPETDQPCQPSQLSATEKVCPLLTGESFECIPEQCGPDAPCIDFINLPDIEDCTSVPCITQNLSNTLDLMQICQPSPKSNAGTVLPRSPSSQCQKPIRHSQQRSLHKNLDDANANTNAKSNAKKAHSLVEKRYRENLNSSIAQLHLALLNTKRFGGGMLQDQEEDPDDQRQALSKVRKSDVMQEAIDYVHQTEVELRHMIRAEKDPQADEIELLRTRVRKLEKLIKCEECPLVKQLGSFDLRPNGCIQLSA